MVGVKTDKMTGPRLGDEQGPQFAEPWEAEALALSVKLQEDGHFTVGEWASALGEEIKAAHRRLVVENHPDKLVAEGLPQEFVDLANEKLATINAAYDRIRGLRTPH